MLALKTFIANPPCISSSFKKGIFEKDRQVIEQTILNHYFNLNVSLLLPDMLSVPEVIKDRVINDTQYYKLKAVPLHYFILQDFIDYFINSGEVTALTLDTWLDADNTLAVTPTGHLILSLDKQTFQSLGVIQCPAIKVKKENQLYFIFINLKETSFKIGKPNYEKICHNFKESGILFNVQLTWEPADVEICPSSVASYFDKLGIEVRECQTFADFKTSYGVKVPPITTDYDDLFEWFATFSLGMKDMEDEISEHVFMEQPESFIEINQVVTCAWTGFITRKKVHSIFNILRELLSDHKDVPWMGFHVQGFDDSPVSWCLNPHCFHVTGENCYSIIVSPQATYILNKVHTAFKS